MNGTQGERWHGTSGGYTNHKCRCTECRAAWAVLIMKMKARRKAAPTPDHVHGTTNGYTGYGCRCADCTRAQSLASNARARAAKGIAGRGQAYKPRSTPEERAARLLEEESRRQAKAEERAARNALKELSRRPPRKPFEEMYLKDAETGCWLWQGHLVTGYGAYAGMGAHRWSYIAEHGSIPNGLHLDHLCRVRSCVKPSHLEPVTPLENFIRGDSRAAVPLRTGLCANGHPFEGENVRIRKHDGRRECVQCNRERCRRYRANAKARLAEKNVSLSS